MKLKELITIVQDLISKNKTKEAIDQIIEWAQDNHQKDLKDNATLIKGSFRSLNDDKNLGLLYHQEANIQKNRITNYSQPLGFYQ